MEEFVQISSTASNELDLFVENCNLFAVFDAPCNLIFVDNFIQNIKKFRDVFYSNGLSDNIFFSCKCNKSLALLKYSAQEHCGVEVSSYYELKDALKFTNKTISSGPAKSKEYIDLAIKSNSIISVDDIEELKVIKQFNSAVSVMIRISNLLNIVSRFGVNTSQIKSCLEIIKNSKINLIGFSFHINNYSVEDRVKAILEVIELVNKYKINIKYIDIGGGFPSNYCSKTQFDKFLKNNNANMYFKNKKIEDFYPYYSKCADEKALNYILKSVKHRLNNIEIIIEPGRSLLKNVGLTIFKVMYLKRLQNESNLIVTNGNINCLSEQWFNTDYLIEPKLYMKGKHNKMLNYYASVCGNLCLEQDMITWRKIKFNYLPLPGDYLIYYNTAAYQMDSNEREFHKIPVLKKYIIEKVDNKYIIKEDGKYDC